MSSDTPFEKDEPAPFALGNDSNVDIEAEAADQPVPEMYRAPTHKDDGFGNMLGKSETAQSLQELGLSTTRPTVDPNYPAVRSSTRPEFPEEYTLETQTGLVPVTSLRQIRSRSGSGSGSVAGDLLGDRKSVV